MNEDTRQLHLAVSDDGIGIPPEELNKIFERFYQSEERGNQERRGSGIGLALVHELVTQLGGEVVATSAKNKGAKFTVILPVPDRDATISESSISIIPTAKDGTGDTPDKRYQPMTDEKAVVLLVEDNPDVMEYMESCLKDDYQTYKSHNGAEGWEIAKDIIPDIVITDLMMPEMDGSQLCEKLKLHKRTSHIPVIMLTAKTGRDVRLDALVHGADAFLNKPFDKVELLIRINNLITTRKELQRKYQSPESTDTSLADPFLADLTTHILTHLKDSDLSVDHLMEWTGMSRTQLYRKIKGITDMSANKYISHVRLEEARRLITSSSLPISEIAYAVGFTDPNYFSRKFAVLYHQTPTEYRKSL